MEPTVAEIRRRLAAADAREYQALRDALADDGRKGVVAALAACEKRLQAQEAERLRLDGLYGHDRQWGASKLVVGLDEVGRGAVAGPLAVGAVVLPDEPRIPLLNDSKQLSPEQRREAAARIKEVASAWAVAYVEPQAIDQVGMAACLRQAFGDALGQVEAQGVRADVVLIDGNPLGLDPREVNVVKGDGKSAAIAAASIVAKVERDALMEGFSSTYPQYGFSSHKGYGSAEHIAAIREHGLCPIHRESFCRSFNQPTLF